MYRILIALLCFASPVLAQQNPIEITSEVERVSVFAEGAQVYRTARSRVPAGQSVLKFVRLDPNLFPNSIQFNGGDGITLMSVSHSRNYLEEPLVTEEANRLETLIQVKTDSLNLEQAMVDVFNQEKEMVMANQSIGGSQSGVELERLESAANFFRERLTEINAQVLLRNKRIKQLTNELQELNVQKQRLVAEQRNTYVSELEVVINNTSAGTRNFTIQYVTGSARWAPQYDLRVSDIDNPLNLFYKASISQSTGEEWEDARLVLSTANPRQQATKPNLLPQWAQFYSPPRASMPAQDMLESVVVEGRAMKEEGDWEADQANEWNPRNTAGSAGPTVQTRTNTTTTEFQIAEPYTIASGVDPSLVDIARHELAPVYEYYAAPAMSKKAFLTARLSGWESLNLLSGPSNLFFNGTFVGQTYLDMQNVTDTLDISLGPDQGIVIERKRDEDFTKKQFIGNKKTDIYGFEIEVRNNKSVPVTIVIEDRVPVSTSSDIDVDLEEDGGAAHSEETGILRWEEVIEPASTKTINFRYSIRYPKDRIVRVSPQRVSW